MTNVDQLRREQTLHEMGLSPIWKLRDDRSVLRKEQPPAQPPIDVAPLELPSISADESLAPRIAHAVEPTAADRPERIARLGWDELQQSVADCRACGLCAERKQAVLGVGDVAADWLFIGEGPGSEEDARGEPFVGLAGKLLDAMLAAIDLRRGEDVYIANAVKCRPPGNRTPEAAEMDICSSYLKRQIVLLQPKVIVLLGRAAAYAVLGEVGTLSALRGKAFAYHDGERNIPVVVTYHPDRKSVV